MERIELLCHPDWRVPYGSLNLRNYEFSTDFAGKAKWANAAHGQIVLGWNTRNRDKDIKFGQKRSTRSHKVCWGIAIPTYVSNTWFDGYVFKGARTPLSALALSSAILLLDKTLKSRCFILVPITSIIRGCPNKAGSSSCDNNKIAISLTVKISEALCYGNLHSSSLSLTNYGHSNWESLLKDNEPCLKTTDSGL